MLCYFEQDFKIQNIVGSCDVKFPIRLEGLAYSHGAFSSVSGNSLSNVSLTIVEYCFKSFIFLIEASLFSFGITETNQIHASPSSIVEIKM